MLATLLRLRDQLLGPSRGPGPGGVPVTPGATAGMAHPPEAPLTGARHVLVASGRGGTGVSVVAGLLALTSARDLATTGRRILLVDAGEGRLGQAELHGLGPLAYDRPLADRLVAITPALSLLPVHAPLDAALHVHGNSRPVARPGDRTAELREAIHVGAAFDAVIVDAGARLDTVRTLAHALPTGATCVAVVQPDPVAAAATYALMKALHTLAPSLPIHVMATRATEADGHLLQDRLADAVHRFTGARIARIGTIPDETSLRTGLAAGMRLGDAAEGSDAAAMLAHLGTALVQLPATPGRPPAPVWPPRA